ncbi:cysteine proteinase [Aureobasidium sp. EXF-10727]|nr:cysteine proteinase [Aureobasidium sp. EXF-10727]
MEHSSASHSRAVSPLGSSSSSNRSSSREKRKLESFLTESGETWEFTRPVKKSRSSGPGSNTSTTALSSPTRTQRPSFSATSPTRGKRSRDPSDQDTDAQSPSPKRQMTSVTDLGDHAAALRRTSWLRSSRSRRKGAAASRSRSPSQGGLRGMFDADSVASQSAGSVESEEELPDYEDDEEVTVGQHAGNNLDQLASFQGPAMTLPPASHYQEGQELRMPMVASIETDQDMEYQVGSSHHQAFETVVSGEYAAVAGNGTYEPAPTTRPVVWSSLDPRLSSESRSPSPVTRYKLARADSSGSESDVDSPHLLRSKFGGFAQAAATAQRRSEAQQHPAREPGYTSTSANSSSPVTAVDTATATTTKNYEIDPALLYDEEYEIDPALLQDDELVTYPAWSRDYELEIDPALLQDDGSIIESSTKPRDADNIQRALSPVPELMEPPTSPIKELSPRARRSPTLSPATLSPTTMDDPSQQLLSELEKYANDRRNWYARQVKHARVNEEEVKGEDVCAQSIHASHNPPNISHIPQPQPDASIPSLLTPTFAHTKERTQHIMAVDTAEGPNEDGIDLLRICLGELDGRMDIDDEDDLAVQDYSRDRIRKRRDEDIRKAKALADARRKFQIQRNHFDEAPDSAAIIEDESDQDDEDLLYTDHLLASSDDHFHAEKIRLQAALEHWESPWPNPSSLPSEHWAQEALTFANNQANASNSAEKHYWACRNIQAESYAEGKFNSGRGSNLHISISLIDWKKSIAVSDEEAEAFAEQVSQIQLIEDDQEAPLRAKLALFLSELPHELDQKVSEILSITNPGRAIVKSPEGNDLTRRDFATLLHSANYRTGEPEGWLNDEIINGFFTALCNAMNDKAGHTKGKVPPYASYITGWYSSVTKKGINAIERWSRRKGIKGDKLLQCKRIFFPVNPGNHWSLLVICPDIHTIEYLDSLDVGYSEDNRKSARYIKLARQWLEMELGNKYVAGEWKEVDRRSSIQNNGSDCGVFTCLNGFASALELSNPTKEFGPEHIPYARRAMVSLFNHGGFNQHFEL